jgi:hypothetical protein
MELIVWMIPMVRMTYKVVQDLVADDARHFEALFAGDGVDNHVAMDADEVLGVEDTVFILQTISASAMGPPKHP